MTAPASPKEENVREKTAERSNYRYRTPEEHEGLFALVTKNKETYCRECGAVEPIGPKDRYGITAVQLVWALEAMAKRHFKCARLALKPKVSKCR